MARAPTRPLLSGSIPAVGFGVGTAWFRVAGTDKEPLLKQSVLDALEAGFRHIDDAEMYGNEEVTGKAISEWLARAGTPRGDLFVTSKAFSMDDPGPEAVCRRSLERMGLQYFDLYLLHAPFQRDGTPFKRSLPDLWRETEGLVEKGLAKVVGVSNWRVRDLEEVYAGAKIKPACNQIEAHPNLQQPKLLQWCKEHDIVVTAYSPLASLTREQLRGGPLEAAVQVAAKRAGKTPAQVLLRWNLQTGLVPITTSSKPERMAEYLQIFDFELTDQEVADISAAGSLKQARQFWTVPAMEEAEPSAL